MNKLFTFTLIASALLLPAALPAKTFEGTVHMTINDGRGSSHPLDYSIKDGLLRTDIQVKSGSSATAIMDFGKDEMIVLMPGQPMYMVMPLKRTANQAAGHTGEAPAIEKTGETEKILGYDCTKYIVQSKEATTEIWATDELGAFMGFGGGLSGPMGKGAPTQSWEKALDGKNFFPLRVVSKTGAKEKFRLDVTGVEAKSLPASFFAAPEGYQKFDMGGMMQGLPGGNPFGQ
ncbi:MAG: DUF4412 domain-containing protein [Opitutaceae bacterium]|nr:DUF4412 domain-containing protein [Opitutaceae bacterium]MBP9913177.1 DUF4412 domain-containing protein [Opitutaceae bacterium]